VLLFCIAWPKAVEVERPGFTVEADIADAANGPRRPYDAALATDPDVNRLSHLGAFFFGAAATVAAALDSIGEHPKAYVIDFSAVPLIDSTAAATIEASCARRIAGTPHSILQVHRPRSAQCSLRTGSALHGPSSWPIWLMPSRTCMRAAGSRQSLTGVS